MSTLKDIETKTKAFADAQDRLSELVNEANDAIAQAKRERRAAIMRALKRAAETKAELQAELEAAPELFAKPRTHVFHGVKVGYQVGRERTEIRDADRTVALIEEHFPDQASVLIKVEKKPWKEAIEQLADDERKKIGVRTLPAGDVVVIKHAATDLEKAVDALFKDQAEEAGVES